MTPLVAQRVRSDRSFERMYKKHVLDVYRYALVVLRNPEDAEDVTQTTFMNAYRAFQRGERPRTAQNWLIAIAHNVCRQRFRQSARRPQEVELGDHADEVVPDDETPTGDDIRRALGHLAFNQRAALVMREIEGRSYAEISEILGVSVGAVETLVFRARRALREQLEGSLTCHEAERAISRQLDRQLPRSERGALRAHLRECQDCARFARSQRAQRTALRTFAMVPLPSSLASFFGGAAAGGGAALVTKSAALLVVGVVATGVGSDDSDPSRWNRAVQRVPEAQAATPPAAAEQSKQPAATFSPELKLPGFVRNADKPGRRVGPPEAVRAKIIARKLEQQARKATRRQAHAPRIRPSPSSRAHTRPGQVKRQRPVPPGLAKPKKPKPPTPGNPRRGQTETLPLEPPQRGPKK
jgi:RNA polymerase sigma-70 factor (ECF subfamily)